MGYSSSSSGVDRQRDGQRRPSRCDPPRRCIETLETAPSTAPNGVAATMAPPSPSDGIFRCRPAARPLPLAVSLRRNDRSLNARRLLRFGQDQSQVNKIAKTFRPADLYQIGAQARISSINQPQHPSHPRSPGPAIDPTDHAPRVVIPPFSGPPAARRPQERVLRYFQCHTHWENNTVIQLRL